MSNAVPQTTITLVANLAHKRFLGRVPVLKILGNPWFQLVLGGLWQGFLVWITWKWDEKNAKLVAIVALAVFPVTAITVQNLMEIEKKQRALQEQIDSAQLKLLATSEQINTASEVGPLMKSIRDRQPEAVPRAHALLNEFVASLQAMTTGREYFQDESSYFVALREEVDRTEKGDVVWDFVMPLKPARVRTPGGNPPVTRLLENVMKAAQRGVDYNLVVMLQDGLSDSEVTDALNSIKNRGLKVFTVERSEREGGLPDRLRANFLYIPSKSVVCVANRADDARVIDGQRIRNDPQEMERRARMKEEIWAYRKPWEGKLTPPTPLRVTQPVRVPKADSLAARTAAGRQ